MKISVIVPVYKAEKYLGATLDSLLGQTHDDLEIVCVNDGSPDRCGEILREYASRDERIVVIEQANQGVSVARNTGIARATGDIVMFVDADDTLVVHACARVNEIFETQSPEALTFGIECDPPEAAPASLRRELSPSDTVYEGFEPALLFKEHARPYACRTALSRSFVQREGIRFEPGLALAEDQVFYFAVYPFSKRTVLSSEKLYIYRMNDESVTHESTDGRRAMLVKLDRHLTAIEAICRIWNERGMRDFCAGELLEWCLDFTMLDISRLPAADQRACYARLMASLDGHFSAPSEAFAVRRPTKACLADIRAALATESATSETANADGVVSSLHKARYYLMRRGFARCAERALMKIGLVK
ncbi:MAG: glycosyltransferase [Slackia faecicanis]|nr:glycosyltransferase [Slackia faecicanis]